MKKRNQRRRERQGGEMNNKNDKVFVSIALYIILSVIILTTFFLTEGWCL